MQIDLDKVQNAVLGLKTKVEELRFQMASAETVIEFLRNTNSKRLERDLYLWQSCKIKT